MGKYLLKRILFSLFSIAVVTLIVMFLTYNLVDRNLIFQRDSALNKLSPNEQVVYKHNKFVKFGYETYENYTVYLAKTYKERYGEDFQDDPELKAKYKASANALNDAKTYAENPDVIEFVSLYKSRGYRIEYYEPIYVLRKMTSKPVLIAIKERNVFERFGSYVANLLKVETIYDVPKSENIGKREMHWEWDKRSNMPALVGNGTTHKYLIYFDNHFPFVHQNLIHLRLGLSVSTGIDAYDFMTSSTGSTKSSMQEYPVDLGTGVKHETSYDFHTVTYSSLPSEYDATIYGEGEHYINATLFASGLSRIGNSFVIGIFSVILCYIFGLPIGIWMARRKDKLVDRIGNFYIIFVIAVPSLAYIFIMSAIGIKAGAPFKWDPDNPFMLSILMPVISLSLPSIGGLMKWMRRYMIDQSNSDYVKFARSTGMTEGEIFRNHISKNAFIYLIHGVPADILFALVGALITERVYAVPGIGGMLTNAITGYDNGIIVAGTVFYTFLSILALILGDLLLAKYDPRVKLTDR